MIERMVRPDERNVPTVGGFRAAAGRFPTGVTVVTVVDGHTGRGMTANSFSSVSLDPLLVLVSIQRNSQMNRIITVTGAFGVSVLGAQQRDIARYFADPARPPGRAQFDAVCWWPAPATGSPLLAGAVAWFDCTTVQAIEAGDHTIFIGRVHHVDHDASSDPLLFFAGDYREVSDSRGLRSSAGGMHKEIEIIVSNALRYTSS